MQLKVRPRVCTAPDVHFVVAWASVTLLHGGTKVQIRTVQGQMLSPSLIDDITSQHKGAVETPVHFNENRSSHHGNGHYWPWLCKLGLWSTILDRNLLCQVHQDTHTDFMLQQHLQSSFQVQLGSSATPTQKSKLMSGLGWMPKCDLSLSLFQICFSKIQS